MPRLNVKWISDSNTRRLDDDLVCVRADDVAQAPEVNVTSIEADRGAILFILDDGRSGWLAGKTTQIGTLTAGATVYVRIPMEEAEVHPSEMVRRLARRGVQFWRAGRVAPIYL